MGLPRRPSHPDDAARRHPLVDGGSGRGSERRAEGRAGGGQTRRVKATFNLEPEFIDPRPLGPSEEEVGLEELTEAQMAQLKESSHRRVKRIVAGVGITLTLVSILLVALSLTLGQKIDDLVGQKARQDQRSREGPGSPAQVGRGANFFLGAAPTTSTTASSSTQPSTTTILSALLATK